MKKIYLICAVALFATLSCVKDNTVYSEDFNDINEVIIEPLEERYEFKLGEPLKITPVIETSRDDESNLSFAWYTYDQSIVIDAPPVDTISTERNLDAVVRKIKVGKDFTLSFKVIDNETGIIYMSQTLIKANSDFSNGLIILGEKGGNKDLFFISNIDGAINSDLYSLNNGGEYLSPESDEVSFITTADTFLDDNELVIAAEDENGGVFLDPNSMQYLMPLRDKLFYCDDAIIDASYCQYSMFGYMFVNNKPMTRRFFSEKFSPAPVYTDGTPNYSVSRANVLTPIFGFGGSILFDETNKRFVGNGHMSDIDKLKYLSGPKQDITHFDPTKVPGDKQIAVGATDDDSSNAWSLMKDGSDYRLLTYQIITEGSWREGYTTSFISKGNKLVPTSIANQLNNATTIVSGIYGFEDNYTVINIKGVANHFFYVEGNKLYMYNVGNDYSEAILDGDTEGFVINNVKVDGNPDDATLSRVILSVQLNSATGVKGALAYYNLNRLGGYKLEKDHITEPFCDKVISFDEI